MHYVYILQSVNHPDQFYTGLCSDVSTRLAAHNAGQSSHTSKYKPLAHPLVTGFDSPETPARFERCLETGAGRAFAAEPAALMSRPVLAMVRPPALHQGSLTEAHHRDLLMVSWRGRAK
jgi:putative endonuclease